MTGDELSYAAASALADVAEAAARAMLAGATFDDVLAAAVEARQTVDPPVVNPQPSWAVPCPRCGVQADEPCVAVGGNRRPIGTPIPTIHLARAKAFEASQQAAATSPDQPGE